MQFLDQFKDKKILHYSHNDLDGIMSTVIGFYYFKPIAYMYDTYNSDQYDCNDYDLHKFKEYDIVIFTDFSPEENVINYMNENSIDYLIFDHHISRKENLENLAGNKYIFDNSKCGCKIFFDTITKGIRVKKVVYQAVEYTNVYDLYQMQSSLWREAKGLNNILWGMTSWFSDLQSTAKHQKFIDAMLYKFSFEKVFYLSKYEINLMEKAEQKEKDNYEIAKKDLSIRIDNSGNKYAYFECSSKVSIVSNWMLQEKPDLKYIICHATFDDKNGLKPKVSIRSLEDRGIDCASIASIYNGGGHKCSSGIEFKNFEDFDRLRKGKMHLI